MNRRVRDPYARWCGRRGAVRRLPIPINTCNSPIVDPKAMQVDSEPLFQLTCHL